MAVDSSESTPTLPFNLTWNSGFDFPTDDRAENDVDSNANSVLSTQKKNDSILIVDTHEAK